MTYYIYIKLTNKCQLRCKHCYNSICSSISMDEDIFNRLIVYLKNFRSTHKDDVVLVSLHGGEPLLYDLAKIVSLIDQCKYLGFYWTATTNLVYELTNAHYEIFNRFDQLEGDKLILTSWDYDIRFTGDQEFLWKSNVIKLRDYYEIQPIVSLTNILIDNLTPKCLFDYFKDLKISRFNFERITDSGRAIENRLKPLNASLDKWLFDAYNLSKEYDFYIPLFESIDRSLNGELIGCRARKCSKYVITINPDGTICGCPNRPDLIYSTIFDDFNKSKYECNCKLESIIDTRCYCCKYFKYCNGDCFQLNWDETGCPGMMSIYSSLIN